MLIDANGTRPHDGWLEMARPFILAFKAGQQSPDAFITEDKLVYWYRPTPSTINCNATDSTMHGAANNASGNFFRGRPNGYETLRDQVFVVSLLTAPATIHVESGGECRSSRRRTGRRKTTQAEPRSTMTTTVFDASAGVNAFAVPMRIGKQSFRVSRDGGGSGSGATVLAGTSLKDIEARCICGDYNFNAYVGMLPAAAEDRLQPAGLARLSQGLGMPCPTNTLGVVPCR